MSVHSESSARPAPGLGEAFMDGRWQLSRGDLGQFLVMLARGREALTASPGGRLLRWLINQAGPKYRHDIADKYEQVSHHYDIGDDLYRSFLDEGMNYSCAFFADPDQSLREAQLNKLRTTIQRLGVDPGMRVLDIGCGWGELTRKLSTERQAQATGVTLARNQLRHAGEEARSLDSPPRYCLQDYREHAAGHPDHYDRIVSIGMVEHVGRQQLGEYFRAIHRQLRPGGQALVHSIVRSGRPASTRLASPWLIRYIFPGGAIPEVGELERHGRDSGLELVQPAFIHESFHYAETLRRWRKNFLENADRLDTVRYDARFRRMWLFYFCMCEAVFEGAGFRVAQVLFRKPAVIETRKDDQQYRGSFTGAVPADQ